MTFDPLNRATWPDCLTAEEVAQIYRRKVGGLKKACQAHRFQPAPFKVHPYLWRRGAIVRDLDGAGVVPMRRSA